jgi:hypothetical protein
VGYEGLEFVPGVKKHLQYSLSGIEETLRITSVEVKRRLCRKWLSAEDSGFESGTASLHTVKKNPQGRGGNLV